MHSARIAQAQRGHSAHMTRRNLGVLLQLAIFLPIQAILQAHTVGHPDVCKGGAQEYRNKTWDGSDVVSPRPGEPVVVWTGAVTSSPQKCGTPHNHRSATKTQEKLLQHGSASTRGQAGFKKQGSSAVKNSCKDLFHHRRRGWAGGRAQKNCLSVGVQTKIKKNILRTYRKKCTTTHTNVPEMRAKHTCNSFECITKLMVTGTKHYYVAWAWSCTNFVHSAGTARKTRPLSMATSTLPSRGSTCEWNGYIILAFSGSPLWGEFNISRGRRRSCQLSGFSRVGDLVASFLPTECSGGRGMWGISGKPLRRAIWNTPGQLAGLTTCLRFPSVSDGACVACCLFLLTGSCHVVSQPHRPSTATCVDPRR